ncbi:MAG TPA: family 20 glycosylhydrolase, partial [Sphingobacteriaceae bacterium]
NLYQSKARDTLAIHGHTTLAMVYNYEPIPDTIKTMGMSHRIMGAQGNVWTEYLPNWKRVEYMIFPRMTALSEVLWSDSDKKNYPDFVRRLKSNAVPRYHYWGSSYFKNFEKPDVDKR